MSTAAHGKNHPERGTGSAWQRRVRWFGRQWLKPILMVLLGVTAFRSAIADWNDVPTGSMEPTVLVGDRVFVNKLAYDLKIPFTTRHLVEWADPARGDIVVCFSPTDGTRLIKRVVGLPGDTVELRNNVLFVNDAPQAYAFPGPGSAAARPSGEDIHQVVAEENLAGRRHSILITPGRSAICSFEPVVVPPGHYLVLGDNRDNSFDSRYFGFVPRNRIVGRASAVVFSLNHNRHYLPRPSRLFRPLP